MTEVARDLWRAVRSRAPGRSAVRVPVVPQPALHVGVRAPRSAADAVVETLRARVEELVVDRLDRLGIARDVVVTRETGGRTARTLEVSCGDRPLLVRGDRGPAGPDVAEAWVDDALHAVEQSLTRRGSLLCDQGHQARLTERVVASARDPRPHLYEGIVGRLLDQGLGVGRLDRIDAAAAVDGCTTAAEIDEVILELVAPEAIHLEVSERTLRNACVPGESEALVDARGRLFRDTGAIYPDVVLLPTDTRAGTVRVWLHDIPVTPSRLPAAATWADVVRTVDAVLRPHAAWFVRSTTVAEQRQRLEPVVRDLVELSRARHSDAMVAACVRSLIANRDSVRNLPRLLWLLLDADPASTRKDTVRLADGGSGEGRPAQWDPELVTSGVRRRTGEEQRVGVAAAPASAPTPIPDGVEERLLAQGRPEAIAEGEWELVRSLAALPTVDTVVVRSPLALRPVRTAVSALTAVPRVVAAQELGPAAARG